jgi:hypothetical protein
MNLSRLLTRPQNRTRDPFALFIFTFPYGKLHPTVEIRRQLRRRHPTVKATTSPRAHSPTPLHQLFHYRCSFSSIVHGCRYGTDQAGESHLLSNDFSAHHPCGFRAASGAPPRRPDVHFQRKRKNQIQWKKAIETSPAIDGSKTP